MSWFDPNASGTRICENLQSGSFNSMPIAQRAESGSFWTENSMTAIKSAELSSGQVGGQMPGGGIAEPFDSHYFFTDIHMYDSRMGTEQCHCTTILESSFESVVSYSTFVSAGLTASSSGEQGDDSTDDMDNIFKGINNILWQPGLLPAYEDKPFINDVSNCQGHKSMDVAIENYHQYHGIFDVEGSTDNPEFDIVLSGVSRSARTWPCYVRLVCACYRLRSKIDMVKGMAQARKNRKKKRCDKSKKHACEIRISKKIPKDGYLKEKAWIGTFATPAERGRALDVGKYFLSTKKKKTFYDPNSEKILSACGDHFYELPLAERVEKVIKLAKYYGENGLLPQSLNSL